MSRRKSRKKNLLLALGNVIQGVGIALAGVGMVVGVMLLSTITPLGVGILIAGLASLVGGITTKVILEDKVTSDIERSTCNKRNADYSVENFEIQNEQQKQEKQEMVIKNFDTTSIKEEQKEL